MTKPPSGVGGPSVAASIRKNFRQNGLITPKSQALKLASRPGFVLTASELRRRRMFQAVHALGDGRPLYELLLRLVGNEGLDRLDAELARYAARAGLIMADRFPPAPSPRLVQRHD